MFSCSRISSIHAAAGALRIAAVASLTLVICIALSRDAPAQTMAGRIDTELIYLCTRAAQASVPDSPEDGADRSRNLLYRACMANGGLSVRT